MCEYCQEEKIRSLKYSKINPNEYINKRYGNVTITDCYWIKEKRYRLYVDYKCDCGNVKSCTLDHLKSGRIKSCGCLKNITMVKRNTKHNLYKELVDKIKAKIEEVKDGTYDAKIVLQSLLEKE